MQIKVHINLADYDYPVKPFGFFAHKKFKMVGVGIIGMSVPDKMYSRNASCILNKISTLYLLFFQWKGMYIYFTMGIEYICRHNYVT